MKNNNLKDKILDLIVSTYVTVRFDIEYNNYVIRKKIPLGEYMSCRKAMKEIYFKKIDSNNTEIIKNYYKKGRRFTNAAAGTLAAISLLGALNGQVKDKDISNASTQNSTLIQNESEKKIMYGRGDKNKGIGYTDTKSSMH